VRPKKLEHYTRASRGAGRALLAALESDARARGLTTMHLNSSLTAIQFYRAQGWQVVERSTYRLSGDVEIACAKMQRLCKTRRFPSLISLTPPDQVIRRLTDARG
jgi:hypothetical protein